MLHALSYRSWPVPAAGAPEKISAEGADPIVVIGTTRDPATPYAWAVRLSEQLADASLITFDGDGHTADTRSTVPSGLTTVIVQGSASPLTIVGFGI